MTLRIEIRAEGSDGEGGEIFFFKGVAYSIEQAEEEIGRLERIIERRKQGFKNIIE